MLCERPAPPNFGRSGARSVWCCKGKEVQLQERLPRPLFLQREYIKTLRKQVFVFVGYREVFGQLLTEEDLLGIVRSLLRERVAEFLATVSECVP